MRWRTGSWMRIVAAIALVLTTVAVAIGPAPPASAHTPHDQVANVALSPAFARDRTVLAISDNQPLRSTDGGEHWDEMMVGIGGQTMSRLAFAPGDAEVAYLTTRDGGVYRTDDQGGRWRRTSPGSGPTGTREVAVSPDDPDVVVVTDILGGLHRSSDGGATWRATPTGDDERVTAVAYAADDGGARLLVGDAGGTLRTSEDDGATFETSLVVDGEAVSAFSPAGERGAPILAGTGGGQIHRSTDGGRSWRRLAGSIPGEHVASLAVAGGGEGREPVLWASTHDDGPHRSRDGGRTWARAVQGITTNPQADDVDLPQFQALLVAAGDDDALFLAGYDGLFATSDGGGSWSEVPTILEYVTGLAVSPTYAQDGLVVANTYVKGVYTSGDRGDTFRSSNVGLEHEISEGNLVLPVRRMHNVVFSPDYAEDRTVFTATWDAFVRSTDGGQTWEQVVVAAREEGESNLRQFVIAVSPSYATDRTIYLGTRQGDVYRSRDGGLADTWTKVSTLSSRVRSIVVAPSDGSEARVYAATEDGVASSDDDGETWTPTGPEEIALLATSPAYVDDGTVLAGTPHGLQVTRDRGRTWTTGTGPVGPDARVEAVAVSPDFARDATVLVSVAGTGLFRSSDGGRTFQAVGADLLEEGLVISDFDNPTSAPLQFSASFATDRTVFGYAGRYVVRSTDGGSTWDQLDLPPAADFPGGLRRPDGTAHGSGHGADHEAAPARERAATPADPPPPVRRRTVAALVLGGTLALGVGTALLVRRRRARAAGAGSPPSPGDGDEP